jgi:CBS-domain-containing membrane protein
MCRLHATAITAAEIGPPARVAKNERMIVLVAVPVLLALLSELQRAIHADATAYLVLPPFAVIVYSIFRNPDRECASARSIVVLPVVGAMVGQLCSYLLGFSPLGIGIATLLVLALQFALRANMPPALALAVLAMLLHAEGPWYVLGVLEGTLVIFAIFWMWRAGLTVKS